MEFVDDPDESFDDQMYDMSRRGGRPSTHPSLCAPAARTPQSAPGAILSPEVHPKQPHRHPQTCCAHLALLLPLPAVIPTSAPSTR